MLLSAILHTPAIQPDQLFYFLQKHRLKFKSIAITFDKQDFSDAVKQAANEFRWYIVQADDELVIAEHGCSWRSWGERITIIHKKDKILFNSICDPDKPASVASWGRNKINRQSFEKIVKQKCHNECVLL